MGSPGLVGTTPTLITSAALAGLENISLIAKSLKVYVREVCSALASNTSTSGLFVPL